MKLFNFRNDVTIKNKYCRKKRNIGDVICKKKVLFYNCVLVEGEIIDVYNYHKYDF